MIIGNIYIAQLLYKYTQLHITKTEEGIKLTVTCMKSYLWRRMIRLGYIVTMSMYRYPETGEFLEGF